MYSITDKHGIVPGVDCHTQKVLNMQLVEQYIKLRLFGGFFLH